jgi:hypothetical protein
LLTGVLVAGTPALAQTNLLTNPGFEDAGGSFNGWTILDGSGPNISTPATDNIARTGVAAAKIFGESTGCPIPNFDSGLFGQAVTPTPGMSYELNAWTYISSADPLTGTNVCGSNRVIAKLVFFDAAVGGAEITSNEILVGDASMPTDQWNFFSVTAPAPPAAQRLEALFIFLQPGCDSGSVFVDDASLYELAGPPAETNILANPGFETDLTGWTTFEKVFHEPGSFAGYSTPGGAKLFGPFTTPGASSGMYQSFAAAPGTDWVLRIWALDTCLDPVTGTNDNVGTLKIVFRDSTGAEIGSGETVLVDATSPLGTWTRHTVVATAPTGTVTVEPFVLFTQPTASSGAMFVDDAVFAQTTLVDAPVVANGGWDLELRPNVPNPFGASTRIEFVLARPSPVSLTVYDVAGRRVAELVRGSLSAGPHRVIWDGTTRSGAPAAAGVYRCVLDTPDGRTSRSLMRIR